MNAGICLSRSTQNIQILRKKINGRHFASHAFTLADSLSLRFPDQRDSLAKSRMGNQFALNLLQLGGAVLHARKGSERRINAIVPLLRTSS